MGGGEGVRQRFIFYTQKNPTSELVYLKKIPTLLAYPNPFANSCILVQTVVLIFFFFSSLTCLSLLFVAVLPDVSASVVPSSWSSSWRGHYRCRNVRQDCYKQQRQTGKRRKEEKYPNPTPTVILHLHYWWFDLMKSTIPKKSLFLWQPPQNPCIFHGPWKIPFGQNFRPKEIPRTPSPPPPTHQ